MDIEGQDPTTTDATSQDGGRDYEAEIAKLRKEAANYRTQARDAGARLKELEPAAQRLADLEASQKTDAQKLQEQIVELRSQAEAAQAVAKRAEAERRLALLAVKAGVAPEALPYLDATKFDLDDESAALEALAVLATSKTTPNVGATNPARGTNGKENPADWYKNWMSGGSSIFSNGG